MFVWKSLNQGTTCWFTFARYSVTHEKTKRIVYSDGTFSIFSEINKICPTFELRLRNKCIFRLTLRYFQLVLTQKLSSYALLKIQGVKLVLFFPPCALCRYQEKRKIRKQRRGIITQIWNIEFTYTALYSELFANWTLRLYRLKGLRVT